MNERDGLMLKLVALFIITQAIGLWVGMNLIQEDVTAVIVTDNPEDVENSIGLMGYILFFTAFLLAIIVFAKGWIKHWVLKIMESFAILGTSFIVFATLIPSTAIVLLLSISVVIARNVLPKHLMLRNLSSVLATAGAGALLGVSLGIIPVLVFIVLLSVYDLIAVFKTKHMVTLAKAITKENLSFTFALPTKKHTFELGTGDMVIPMVVAVSVLKASSALHLFPINLIASIFVLGASLGGLLWTINYSSKHIGKALPALPPQTLAMVFVLAIIQLTGFLG